MKTLRKSALAIALITLFASCQSTSDPKQVLSNNETRKEIIDAIANSMEMSKEMMEAMMSSKNGKMMMQGNEDMTKMMMENHEVMMKMMKGNPGMMDGMMSDMMNVSKTDTSMMSSMCKAMMGDKQMMDRMQEMKKKNMDMSKMKGMDKKLHQ